MKQIAQVAVNLSQSDSHQDWKVISLQKYITLDVKTRTQFLLKGKVQFFDDSGAKIPVREALNLINSSLLQK